MRAQPKLSRNGGGIDIQILPPRFFIAVPMDLAMMSSAQRHGELVADLAAECSALSKA
jgi:hypothetical protein